MLPDGSVYFSPAIIQGLGNHGSIHTQLLSVPPYASAFVIGMLVAALSDHFKHRFTFIMFGLMVSITGFIILIVEHHDMGLQYAAIFLAATGTYSAMPIILCWFSMNGTISPLHAFVPGSLTSLRQSVVT